MSYTLVQDTPVSSPRSVPIGGALKEGFLFPFKMDKEKAKVFGLHMLFMVLGVTGYFTLDVPHGGSFSPSAAGQVSSYLCAILCWGTLMLSCLYTLQRVVMGRPTHSYLRLAFSAHFGKFIIYFVPFVFFMSVLAYITFDAIVNIYWVAMFFSILSTFLFVTLGILANYYAMSRLAMIVPDVAMREGARMGDGWRMARGYVFEIFCVRQVFGVLIYSLLSAFYGIWLGLELDTFTLTEVKAQMRDVSFDIILCMCTGALVGLLSWFFMSLPAALGRLYKDIREDRAAEVAARPVETALAADEIINTTPTGVNP